MNELYPELIDYIFRYHRQYFTDIEKKALNHYSATKKFKDWPDSHPKIVELKTKNLTTDEDALNLLKNGYSQMVINIATRIYNEHKNDLKFNFCPNAIK